ncbi:MAG: molecular chaperone HtpG, partial [Bacteroidetes bacterium]|nr:molecular chaperone HtpG [Bacteroidota bacterium]
HGVIDSPDIPLNVSRSYLQSDHNVQKISNHIQKKVADRLEKMFKEDRADFESKWEDIRVFIEYGMLTQEKFNEKMDKIYLVKDESGKFHTIEEYKAKVEALQKDKNDKTVILYTHDLEEQHALVNQVKERGYDVVIMDSPLTSHILMRLETKHHDIAFVRVDSNPVEKLIDKGEDIPSKLSKEEQESLKPLVEALVDKKKFTVEIESMSESDAPMLITQSEFMRRMKEQQMTGGGGMMMGQFPEMYNLVVNANHPLIGQVNSDKDEAHRKALLQQSIDLAMLSQGMLRGERLTTFIQRSLELIQ